MREGVRGGDSLVRVKLDHLLKEVDRWAGIVSSDPILTWDGWEMTHTVGVDAFEDGRERTAFLVW